MGSALRAGLGRGLERFAAGVRPLADRLLQQKIQDRRVSKATGLAQELQNALADPSERERLRQRIKEQTGEDVSDEELESFISDPKKQDELLGSIEESVLRGSVKPGAEPQIEVDQPISALRQTLTKTIEEGRATPISALVADQQPPSEVSLEAVAGPGAKVVGTRLEAIKPFQNQLAQFEARLQSPRVQAAMKSLAGSGLASFDQINAIVDVERKKIQSKLSTAEARFESERAFGLKGREVTAKEEQAQASMDRAQAALDGIDVDISRLAESKRKTDIDAAIRLMQLEVTAAKGRGGTDPAIKALNASSALLQGITGIMDKAPAEQIRVKGKGGKTVLTPLGKNLIGLAEGAEELARINLESLLKGNSQAKTSSERIRIKGAFNTTIIPFYDSLLKNSKNLPPVLINKLKTQVDRAEAAEQSISETGEKVTGPVTPPKAKQLEIRDISEIEKGDVNPADIKTGTRITDEDPSTGRALQEFEVTEKDGVKSFKRTTFTPEGQVDQVTEDFKTSTEFAATQKQQNDSVLADKFLKDSAEIFGDQNLAQTLVNDLGKKPWGGLTSDERALIQNNSSALFGTPTNITSSKWEALRKQITGDRNQPVELTRRLRLIDREAQLFPR